MDYRCLSQASSPLSHQPGLFTSSHNESPSGFGSLTIHGLTASASLFCLILLHLVNVVVPVGTMNRKWLPPSYFSFCFLYATSCWPMTLSISRLSAVLKLWLSCCFKFQCYRKSNSDFFFASKNISWLAKMLYLLSEVKLRLICVFNSPHL